MYFSGVYVLVWIGYVVRVIEYLGNRIWRGYKLCKWVEEKNFEKKF